MAIQKIKLSAIDTKAPKKLNKEQTKLATTKLLIQLAELQNLLYASNSHSILLVIQGMDASGKDGLIKDVLGSLNPQGVSITSYKAPTTEELSHDFLWRIHRDAPAKGMIKVYNRSHYEDVLVTRVHGWCNDALATKRITAINHYESLLTQHANTTIIKLYLHISQSEQHKRLTERMQDPAKMWKYNANDWEESKLWPTYMKMYEAAITQTNAVPWHIIPADQNWYKEHLVTQLLVKAIISLNLKYPGLKK